MSSPPAPPNSSPPAITPSIETPLTIEITMKDQNHHEVSFKVKPTMKLEKMFNAYCTHESKSRNSLRFFFDGQRLDGDMTPMGLEMVDDDIIEVFTEQIGG